MRVPSFTASRHNNAARSVLSDASDFLPACAVHAAYSTQGSPDQPTNPSSLPPLFFHPFASPSAASRRSHLRPRIFADAALRPRRD
eukprot:1317828-Rhodomonas_salina.8